MSTNISKKMLINVMHPEEARFAIVHDGRLMELNIEISGQEQTKGNIYKGVVLRVEPGLQAAFVDIGQSKPGFLQMGELHPDFWQWRDDVPEEERKRRPRIQQVLRRGQELIVQVEKDGRDHKGAALTSYLSLPGRYMVIMPGSDSTGISRKIEREGERKRLKEQIAEMTIPEGIGYIIRTEAVGRTTEELQKDLDSLVERYHEIKARAEEIKGAGEIYQDSGLILRTIRDYFSDDIDEILVDNKDAFKQAQDALEEIQQGFGHRVKLHKEKRPIFSKYQLEEQIDQIYEKRVTLPSGGYLIIEPTEALVSIDVNSGKSSGERGVEDTAFKTNLEAVEEAARQLRLRDLGGLIVIDCIDMRETKHNKEVEKTLKSALKADKARVNVGRISEFGLLEMSRQRIAKTINDAIHLECPHCEGRGKVKSVEAMALSFLRKVHAAAAKGNLAEVRGELPLEVAYYLLNRKKRELTQIENDYDIEVTVKGKPSFTMNQLDLAVFRREKSAEDQGQERDVDAPKHVPAAAASPAEEAESAAEGGKKRKRRRKKKKHGAETAVEEQAIDTSVGAEPAEAEPHAEHGAEAGAHPHEHEPHEGDAVAKHKKRKRRRSRKGGKGPDTAAATGEAAETEQATTPAAPAPSQEIPPAEEAAEPKPKRPRAPRAKKKPAAAPTEESPTKPAPATAAPEAEPAAATPKKPRRAAAKKAKAPAEPVPEVMEPVVEKPKKATRPRRKKPVEPSGE